MTLVVPNDGTSRVLEVATIEQILTLRLFGNDISPSVNSVQGDFTEISGGNYASVILSQGSWIITTANPSIATYDDFVEWTFNGVTSPVNIYGYYITDDQPTSLGGLLLAERFPVTPFTPENGAVLRVKPRITCVYTATP
jgi:hypothetical protein